MTDKPLEPPSSRWSGRDSGRVPLIAGNWKMNLLWRDAQQLVEALLASPPARDREVLVCPPFPWLAGLRRMLEGKSLRLGAQDVYWEANGAFTGEVSAPILKDVGCSHCIVGHSERRLKFGETDESVHKKVVALLEYGLTPVICCGETLREHQEGQTCDVVCAQIRKALHHLPPGDVSRTVIAYEPIWAIGTGLSDTPPNANETMGTIRQEVAREVGDEVAGGLRILYGGSVNAQNIDSFMAQTHIDGALVGGASLKADSFLRIMGFLPDNVAKS